MRRGCRISGSAVCAALVCLLPGCHPGALATNPAVGANAPRRPPGIALDPPTHVGKARSATNADAEVAVLVQPASRTPALTAVHDFLLAVVHKDLRALATLFTPDATQFSGSQRQTSRAIDHWRARVDHLDYSTLSPHLIYSPSAVSVMTERQLESRSSSVEAHLALRPGEILVMVPISTTASASGRFGKVIELALTQLAGDYRIRALREDFQLP